MARLRRPRDANGWRIPREGSKSRVIYDLLAKGFRSREIAEATGYDPLVTRVLVHKIKNPLFPMDWGRS